MISLTALLGLVPAPVGGDVTPWMERWELALPPSTKAPITEEALAEAAVLIVKDEFLHPTIGGFTLDVWPWDVITGNGLQIPH